MGERGTRRGHPAWGQTTIAGIRSIPCSVHQKTAGEPRLSWPGCGIRIDKNIESRLIRQACEGDGRAVRALYERYSPRVYAVVRRIAGDDDLAQDYCQEVWIRAIRALPTFRGEARFSTWLHRIAVNSALQAVRKAKAARSRELPLPPSIPVTPRMGDPLLNRTLHAALERLPDGMRTVLILHDVEGYTHAEIGEVLGVSTGTSKSQLFKARAKMRDMLRGYETHAKEVGA